MKLRLIAIFFALSMLFSLVACSNSGNSGIDTTAPATDVPSSPTEPVTVRIQTLNGTTGFGMAKLMEDNANGAFTTEKYEIAVKTDAVAVRDALLNGSIDIAALPTNAASVAFNKSNGAVKIIAINTLGCLFLLNTGSEAAESFADLGGKTVYTPAQNPAFIFTYLCQQNGLTVVNQPTTNKNEIYIDSTTYAQPADLQKVVSSGKVALAVLPEPMVTIAVNGGKNATPAVTVNVEMDLTAEWDKLPEKANTLVQGCVVVRKAFLEAHPEAVANFLKAYKASIEYLNANIADAAKLVVKHGIFANEAVAKLAIPKCNVKYVDGAAMKTSVAAYLDILKSVNASSIGGKLPTDDFYHVAG